MRNIKLIIEYDGTKFNGWQIQSTERTVQNEITRALKKICSEPIKLIGSGRTDTGVHAAGQVANFKTTTKKPTEELLCALNANLPEDIAIIGIKEVADDFHAQYHVKSKIYRYTILNRQERCALSRKSCLHYPYTIDIDLLKKEARSIIGRHDFKSFTSTNRAEAEKEKSTVRTIKDIKIRKSKDIITIDIEADGFLYKMVRNIVGTLLEISSKNKPKGTMLKILNARSRAIAAGTAKPHGLTLLHVLYEA